MFWSIRASTWTIFRTISEDSPRPTIVRPLHRMIGWPKYRLRSTPRPTLVRPLQDRARARSRTIPTRFADYFLFSNFYIYSLPHSLFYTHTLHSFTLFSSLLFSLSNMDHNNFPNPNSADDDMPMFSGGGGDACWPGHDDNHVETPWSVGSTFVLKTGFDHLFNTDAYRVDEMEPSYEQHSVPNSDGSRKFSKP